jgi:hypothetical protein
MLAQWSQRKVAPAKVAAVEVAVAAVEVAVAAVEVVVVAAAHLKATMINFRNASRMPLQVGGLQPNHK